MMDKNMSLYDLAKFCADVADHDKSTTWMSKPEKVLYAISKNKNTIGMAKFKLKTVGYKTAARRKAIADELRALDKIDKEVYDALVKEVYEQCLTSEKEIDDE